MNALLDHLIIHQTTVYCTFSVHVHCTCWVGNITLILAHGGLVVILRDIIMIVIPLIMVAVLIDLESLVILQLL